MIYSTPKCQAGLCELYPFPLVTKRFWFIDHQTVRQAALLKPKASFQNIAFEKQPDLNLKSLEITGSNRASFDQRTAEGLNPALLSYPRPARTSYPTPAFYRVACLLTHAATRCSSYRLPCEQYEVRPPTCAFPSMPISLASFSAPGFTNVPRIRVLSQHTGNGFAFLANHICDFSLRRALP